VLRFTSKHIGGQSADAAFIKLDKIVLDWYRMGKIKQSENNGKALNFHLNKWHDSSFDDYFENWKDYKNGKECYNFNGAFLPCNDYDSKKIIIPAEIFIDTFLVPCFFEDNYCKTFIDKIDKRMHEGPYGYKDAEFDVTVKADDIVIDAGAWIGDFSAYAASKGATAYAFEPTTEIFRTLNQTAELNDGKIYPVQMGLGRNDCEISFFIDSENGTGNSVFHAGAGGFIPMTNNSEIVKITTLDKFADENKLNKIDFIKADIEGAERDMLIGAKRVLKEFAPKLAICTYHLKDDPVILEKIIRESNPKYKIVHLHDKLFACV
jgi:FkbM family methyltransferase